MCVNKKGNRASGVKIALSIQRTLCLICGDIECTIQDITMSLHL